MELSEILKHIEDEPELPGNPPDEMKDTLRMAISGNDVELLVEVLQLVVRHTKRGIADRITTAYTGLRR